MSKEPKSVSMFFPKAHNKKALSNLSKIHHCYLCRKEKDDYRVNRNQSSDIGIQKVKYVTREYAGKGKYIDEILK